MRKLLAFALFASSVIGAAAFTPLAADVLGIPHDTGGVPVTIRHVFFSVVCERLFTS